MIKLLWENKLEIKTQVPRHGIRYPQFTEVIKLADVSSTDGTTGGFFDQVLLTFQIM